MVAPSRPTRITVVVSPTQLAAIRLVIARERVSRAEAVCRLITYGEAVYRWWVGAAERLAAEPPTSQQDGG